MLKRIKVPKVQEKSLTMIANCRRCLVPFIATDIARLCPNCIEELEEKGGE